MQIKKQDVDLLAMTMVRSRDFIVVQVKLFTCCNNVYLLNY